MFPGSRRGSCYEHPDRAVFIKDAPSKDEVRLAKSICGTCPVKRTCHEWALDQQEIAGIWAGLTVEERARLINNKPGTKLRVCGSCGDPYVPKDPKNPSIYCYDKCRNAMDNLKKRIDRAHLKADRMQMEMEMI